MTPERFEWGTACPGGLLAERDARRARDVRFSDADLLDELNERARENDVLRDAEGER